jgi:preprotein translocase subunit SecA
LRKYLAEHPCGLHVIGSERHEARRIDRQLRGRCARQGDPGSSRFYISLEDDLMRLFGSERIAGIMSRLGLEEGQELEHSWLNRSIETAQRRVEQQNFSIRKRTLEYDDVMNKQREIVYGFRGEAVCADNVREIIYDLINDVIGTTTEVMLVDTGDDAIKAYVEWVQTTFPIPLRLDDVKALGNDRESIADTVYKLVESAYQLKISMENEHSVAMMERYIVLQAIDSHWQEYLRAMDGLRQGVGLRAYGQRDPLVEYKSEAYTMFEHLMADIKTEIVNSVFRTSTSVENYGNFLHALPMRAIHEEAPAVIGDGVGNVEPTNSGPSPARRGSAADRVFDQALQSGPMASARPAGNIGRNDPCPCGSGKKYKKCCGI